LQQQRTNISALTTADGDVETRSLCGEGSTKDADGRG
jgi:hypothetical protein